MTSVSVPREKLAKVLSDVELLIADVTSLVDEDTIAKERLTAMRADAVLVFIEFPDNDHSLFVIGIINILVIAIACASTMCSLLGSLPVSKMHSGAMENIAALPMRR